jgi:biopolymer transport protein ExbB/TolQ
MYAIAAAGAYALAVALERAYWLMVRWRVDVDAVFVAIDGGSVDAAKGAAGDTPLGDVVRAGIDETDPELAWEAMGAAAIGAHAAIRARVGSLATVGNISTMLGLLGTVYGLIIAFSGLSDTSGGERAASLSEGISTAMSTTGAGLAVGIFALVLHSMLDARSRGQLESIERAASRIAVRIRRSQ